jgi:hypothetical protein
VKGIGGAVALDVGFAKGEAERAGVGQPTC